MTRDSGPAREGGGLLDRSVSALKWSYAGVAVRTLLQLVIGIVLARLLGPGPFGIVAVAWLVLGVCNLFADFGFASALVQKSELLDQDVQFVFACQVILGAAFSIVGILAAPQVAAYFRIPEAVAAMQAMFSLFVIQALGQTSSAVLRRGLDFRSLQLVSITSYVFGYALIGIPCAALGLGVWALVAAYLSQAVVSTAGLMLRARIPLRWSWKPASTGLIGFGGKVIGANLTSWGISNLDSMVVGRMLGVTELGLYNRAITLVSSPMAAFVSGLQGVLFSACSRGQSRPEQLRRAYLGATAAVGLVCLPLFFAIAAVAETVVVGLYGAQWSEAAAALRPLALAMPLTALLAVAGPVLMSMDRVADELKAQWLALLVMMPVLYLAANRSMAAVAWSMLAIYLLRWALLARAVLRAVEGSWGELLSTLRWPALLASSVALSVWAADVSTVPFIREPAPRLVLLAVVGGAAMLVGLRWLGRRLMQGDLGHFMRSRGALPAPIKLLLNLSE